MPNNRSKQSSIHLSISAQQDNLGDIEIRHTLVEWLAETNVGLRIFIGDMPDDYVAAYNLPPGTCIFTSSLAFQLDLFSSVLQRRATLVFAPGPQSLATPGGSILLRPVRYLRGAAKSAVNLFNTLIVRASGGSVLSIGRAIRGDHRLALVLERYRAVASNHYSVRDTASAVALGREVRMIPDLALAHMHLPTHSKSSLAIVSLRGDRLVDEAGLRSAVQSLRSRGFDPVFLTQVQSDEANHRRLAAALGCSVVGWPPLVSHKAQLRTVRETYQQAAVVISDRLHALIFGLQNGAIPVAVVHPGSDKLTSTLSHIAPLKEVDARASDWSTVMETVTESDLAEQIRQAMVANVAALNLVRRDVVSLLAGTNKRDG